MDSAGDGQELTVQDTEYTPRPGRPHDGVEVEVFRLGVQDTGGPSLVRKYSCLPPSQDR